MKGLFDELNNILPNSPGSKSSKWEILTKCMFTPSGTIYMTLNYCSYRVHQESLQGTRHHTR